MTEHEAQRLLNEHRDPPRFVVGRFMFVIRRDGTVGLWKAVGKSGMRWASDRTISDPASEWWLPAKVRDAAASYGGTREKRKSRSHG